jgi:hypothetical protein
MDEISTMMRVRLKADGRIVEILADGSESEITNWLGPVATAATSNGLSNGSGDARDAAYAPQGDR